jgi:hypothetical protein
MGLRERVTNALHRRAPGETGKLDAGRSAGAQGARRLNLSTLQIALLISVAVHAALLTLRIVDPQRFDRIFQDTPLEVVLVNARSKERVDKAQALANASLAGGGDADRGRATSPLPPSPSAREGDALDEAQRRVAAMQAQQTALLAQVRAALATFVADADADFKEALFRGTKLGIDLLAGPSIGHLPVLGAVHARGRVRQHRNEARLL